MVWQAFVHVVRWRCSTWQKRNQENGIAQKNICQLCRFDLCVSFPSPKHDSDRSSGKRSRVLLHSTASSFRVACQTPKKGQSLRCVVEWSITTPKMYNCLTAPTVQGLPARTISFHSRNRDRTDSKYYLLSFFLAI